jgi:hypothetical protein
MSKKIFDILKNTAKQAKDRISIPTNKGIASIKSRLSSVNHKSWFDKRF